MNSPVRAHDLSCLAHKTGPVERLCYHLGDLNLTVESNALPSVSAYLHSFHQIVPDTSPDWRVSFLKIAVSELPAEILSLRSPSYRGERLLRGHYLGHHLGKPALMVQHGLRDVSFIGEEPGKLFWTFFLKFALTAHHLGKGILHLKATAVNLNDGAYLLLGRGGSGKSELAQRLCRRGASLMGNTHCLIEGARVLGIGSAVRLRGPEGEHLVRPAELDVSWSFEPAILRGLIFMAGKSSQPSITPLEKELAMAFAGEFAAAVNNYDLKEDLADYAGSVPAAAEIFHSEVHLLSEMIKNSPTVLASLDVTDPGHVEVLEEAMGKLYV